MEPTASFEDLVAIMDRLRGPDGCPWDREQSFASLRRYLVEECHEVAEALDRGDRAALCEELGDLLFQIVFLARLASEEGRFGAGDVVRTIAAKMIRRHPHVFGTTRAATAEEVVRHWEAIKERERAAAGSGPRGALEGIPAALPPTLKAHLLGERAARVGFDWSAPEQVLEQAEEELAELRRALAQGDRRRITAELGDLLFTVVMASRHLRVDADAALEATNREFRARFEWIESELAREGRRPADCPAEELERLWRSAKRARAGAGSGDVELS